jgi:hypothetical protein
MILTFIEGENCEDQKCTVESFVEVLITRQKPLYYISNDVAKFVQNFLLLEGNSPIFRGCFFAFNNKHTGQHFLECSTDGNIRKYSTPVPQWFIKLNMSGIEKWLIQENLDKLLPLEFIDAINRKFTKETERKRVIEFIFRTKHSDDLQIILKGNVNGRSTSLKVSHIDSYQIFNQFFNNLERIISENRFPTMHELAGIDAEKKINNNVRRSIHTWMKCISGELLPNSKRIQAGNSELYCIRMKEIIIRINKFGLECFFNQMKNAVAVNEGKKLSTFSFEYTEKKLDAYSLNKTTVFN